MRNLSASMIKQNGKHRTEGGLPRPNTVARNLYDLLFKYKGQFLPLEEWKNFRNGLSSVSIKKIDNTFIRLEDYFGCVIRKKQNGRYKQPMLEGEWLGPTYKDYALERFETLAKDENK